MAKFVGSKLKTGNKGEDFVVQKLIEYCDDNSIIYRNRNLYGSEFDSAILIPGLGVIIFEVKDWDRKAIIDIPNGDTIKVWQYNKENRRSEQKDINPMTQAKSYTIKLENKIKFKTGKKILIYPMVCFPSLTKRDYLEAAVDVVCEDMFTFVKEDFENKEVFLDKLNKSYNYHKKKQYYRDEFNADTMFRVRRIFEATISPKDRAPEGTIPVPPPEPPNKTIYSILAYLPGRDNNYKRIQEIVQLYEKGTKLFLFFEKEEDLNNLASQVCDLFKKNGLYARGLDLEIDFSGEYDPPASRKGNSFTIFNCSAFLIPTYKNEMSSVQIINGEDINEGTEALLQFADKNSIFNYQQYRIEHSSLEKNIVVRAGAGTGKTYTMISRIAFICTMEYSSMLEMASRIVMITFTDDAAEQMKRKMKQHFDNYYLLTSDSKYLDFIQQIERMQISTIHSYAKKIISMLSFEYGYGVDLSITSGDFYLKQCIAKTVDQYIADLRKKEGPEVISEINLPMYKIKKYIFDMIARLHNQSVDIAGLQSGNFGEADLQNGSSFLHRLFATVIPEIQTDVDEYFRKQNKIALNNSMALLDKCTSNPENQKRLLKAQTGKPQYMFVDEFQDTDDIQIDALRKIAKLLEYKLFVVGDVKQCIYRFRGAQENAFERLEYKDNDEWESYYLYKNYRTDTILLSLFHESFDRMGKQGNNNIPLLIYGRDSGEEGSRLIGEKKYHENEKHNKFYHQVSISQEADRMDALFREISRVTKEISNMISTGHNFRKEELNIAILVRENWQAEEIRKEGKKHGIDIQTNTGGDLYASEPAIDMLTLANALLHFDEADYLYQFVSSNFIKSDLPKIEMIKARDSEKSSWKKGNKQEATQKDVLIKIINEHLRKSDDPQYDSWEKIIEKLRVVPVFQILRKIYTMLEPWKQMASDIGAQGYYQNVDLLFEELIGILNMDSITINSIAETLWNNIVSQRNVDSRQPDSQGNNDIVIQCITVHKSKGLEYGAVILPYCSFPIWKMKKTDINVSVIRNPEIRVGYQIQYNEDNKESKIQNDYFDETMELNERMREEARILYVAMTRSIYSFSWIRMGNKETKSWQNLIWEEQNHAV